MSMKSQASNAGSYEDFQPSTNWIREDSVDTIVIHLPGFKKENLRVQIDSHGNLKISGERPLDDNRFYRFRKEFRVPENCSRNEITAKFYAGLLYVKLPKKIADVPEEVKPTLTQEAQIGHNTANERKSEQELDSDQSIGFNGRLSSRLKKHRKLVVGVVVTLSIAISLGIYGVCKLRSSGGGGGHEVSYNVNH